MRRALSPNRPEIQTAEGRGKRKKVGLKERRAFWPQYQIRRGKTPSAPRCTLCMWPSWKMHKSAAKVFKHRSKWILAHSLKRLQRARRFPSTKIWSQSAGECLRPAGSLHHNLTTALFFRASPHLINALLKESLEEENRFLLEMRELNLQPDVAERYIELRTLFANLGLAKSLQVLHGLVDVGTILCHPGKQAEFTAHIKVGRRKSIFLFR